ncbi:alpha/beta fold hydrolase [Actinoplanes sp. DH11]|uniref:alpha/beta fold hydrolase n=1 Tax=Actinoplanes sp. DH11 TaxID=2857011 RepID=UPI001E606BE6|nr:alpha/beta hydrolase [Actinoplanes sp. DH11]
MAELSYERRGSGPVLVLIHGLGSHRQVWSPILDTAARHRDVIALDLPGFGSTPLPAVGPGLRGLTGTRPGARSGSPGAGGAAPRSASGSRGQGGTGPSSSPGPAGAGPQSSSESRGVGGAGPPSSFGSRGAGGTGPGSVGRYADQVAAFLDGLGVRAPEIAGSSLGGGVALELGRRGHARAVTAFAPVGFWHTPGRLWCQTVVTAARAGAERLDAALPRILNSRAGRSAFCAPFYAHPGRLPAADALAAARALAAAPGFAGARDAFSRLRPWQFAEMGELTRIPVTIAWGTRDAILPYRTQARRARTVLPTARHVTLPGCGHLPFADDPARCLAALGIPS